MTMLDLRGVPQAGREIRITDTAFGFEQALTSELAARRSSYQQALELLGLYIQFSGTDTGPWSAASQPTDTSRGHIDTMECCHSVGCAWTDWPAWADGSNGQRRQ